MSARRPPTPLARLYRVAPFADILGMHKNTISKWCRDGKIRSVVVSARGDRLIPSTELDRLLGCAERGEALPDRAP